MGKYLYILLVCLALAGQATGSVVAGDTNDYELSLAAKEKVCEFYPIVKTLGEEHPNNVEIQMGIVFLYGRGGTRKIPGYSRDDQIEIVLAIDPDNRPAWALKTKRICTGYTSRRNFLLDHLEDKIDNARERTAGEMWIREDSPLYKYLKEKGSREETSGAGKGMRKSAVINEEDFELAVQHLQEKLDEEIPAVLAMLNEGQSIDPDNALYNYLRAHLYFELDEKDKAISQIEKAVVKKYLNNYSVEKNEAIARVLWEVDFPQLYTDSILEVYTPFLGNYLASACTNGLRELVKKYEAQEDFESAEKIYKLMIGMAKQVKEEPVPFSWASEGNIQRARFIEEQANLRIEELHKRMLK